MHRSLSRRDLLKWLGAGALATPVLAAPFRRALAAGRPRRLFILYTPHGAPAEFFWPQSATNLSSGGEVSILEPLQRHAAKLNVIRGINYVGSNNHYANRDVLTNKTSSSIETVIAKRLGVRPLRLGVVPDYPGSFTVDGYLSFDEDRPQQHKPDPVAIFDELVGGPTTPPVEGGGGGGDTPAPTGPSAAQLRAVALGRTDAELNDLRIRLADSPVSTSLKAHHLAVQKMRVFEAPPAMTGGSGESPPPPAQPAACAKGSIASVEKLRGKNVWAHENFPDVMDAQLDIAEMALRCGVTRVVSVQAGYVNHGIPFTWAGLQAGHHELSHNSPGSPGRAGHARAQQYFAQKLAAFMDKLNVADPEDPANTILDNTALLWCSELADGQAHNCEGIPIVLAGGGGGYLRTGQYLDLGNRSHAELLLALCGAMDVSGVTIGAGSEGGALREVKA